MYSILSYCDIRLIVILNATKYNYFLTLYLNCFDMRSFNTKYFFTLKNH